MDKTAKTGATSANENPQEQDLDYSEKGRKGGQVSGHDANLIKEQHNEGRPQSGGNIKNDLMGSEQAK